MGWHNTDMDIRTIDWKNGKIKIVDQTRLPRALVYLEIGNLKELWRAIRELKVRGAPALGAAAALGVYLGIKDYPGSSRKGLARCLKKTADYLKTSRPTARNLFGGIERIEQAAARAKDITVPEIKKELFKEALRIIEDDRAACRAIGRYGAALIKNKSRVLTICNAGILATIDYGTALGVIYAAKEKGREVKVFASETRPLLQGARLSTWELYRKGVDVTLIADNTAAKLMADGEIDMVIAGADRIALNGDTANKVGTANLAIAAAYHKVPFYIASPKTTFDLSIKDGSGIRIEMRPEDEVRGIFPGTAAAPRKVKVLNPAFDITPHRLIRGIITDYGIVRPPYRDNIAGVLGKG